MFSSTIYSIEFGIGRENSLFDGDILLLSGWVYYHISNAMQYSNMALETTALVMHDSNTFFYVLPLFLMAQRIS